MNDNYREYIHNNLNTRETEDLLEIWQKGDTSEWEKEVFEIIKEILLERLGYIPPQSIETQILQILDKVEEHIENNEFDKALNECELAIQMDPDSAIAYNDRGIIYEEMGQLGNAIVNYQKAIQLDPELKVAWENILSTERELKREFEGSAAKQHLNRHLIMPMTENPKKRWLNAKQQSH
jgi:tetratricopeptide (TPR) repeat protein